MARATWAILLFLACCGADDAVRVHLRTGSFEASHAVDRPSSRRRLLQNAHNTEHAAWAMMAGAHQFLLSHAPHLSHEQRHELAQHIEAAGCQLLGAVPDHTLLVAGSAEAAEAAAAHGSIVGSALLAPAHKLAPEWELVKARLAQALEESGGQELPPVAVQVVFPSLATPRQHARSASTQPSHHRQQQQQEQQQKARVRRALAQQQRYDAGAAAVADWAAPLARRFGRACTIRRDAAHLATVHAPAAQLAAVLDWLLARPAVQWVAPGTEVRQMNQLAASITQAGQAASGAPADAIDPTLEPVWAAGLTGAGQVVGCGDSGLDRQHCHFYDPAVPFNDTTVSMVDGVRVFDSTDHYKIRLYRAMGDTRDSNGHGTHVAGTLVGRPKDAPVASGSPYYIGMAPDAKLAFIDLGRGKQGKLQTPGDLDADYLAITSAVGAAVHSASWGSTSIYYDAMSAMVDKYSWEHPEFLAVFPAGNDGEGGGTFGGATTTASTTVVSPGNSKNCLCVGATLTAGESLEPGAEQRTIFSATATVAASNYTLTFPVLQATFGPGVATLGTTTAHPLAVALPVDGCSPLRNSGELSVEGAVALLQRGECYFDSKAAAAAAAGAVAALIYDDKLAGYFPVSAGPDAKASIPAMAIPRRVGQTLRALSEAGHAISLTFAPAASPPDMFQYLSPHTSHGPTADGRIKPDLVAPGTITSAKQSNGSQETCEFTVMEGTSMATPVAGGSAALVRQYFLEGFYPSGERSPGDALQPSGALLKAVLLSGASPLRGLEADTGLPLDPPPSFRQGYGRLALGRSLLLKGSAQSPARLQMADQVEINAGEQHFYCVTGTGGPLSVTLVWMDYPASPVAAKALVNDLDLTVTAAGLGGLELMGNGGSVLSPGTPDRENNVEQVVLEALPAGSVLIQVKAHSIYTPGGAPSYALVIAGAFEGSLARSSSADGTQEQCADGGAAGAA